MSVESIIYRFTDESDSWTWPDGETEALVIVQAPGGGGGDGYVSLDETVKLGGTGGGAGGKSFALVVKGAETTLEYDCGDGSVIQDGTDVCRAIPGDDGIQSTDPAGQNNGGAGGTTGAAVGDTKLTGGDGGSNGYEYLVLGVPVALLPGRDGAGGGGTPGNTEPGGPGQSLWHVNPADALTFNSQAPSPPAGGRRGGYGGESDPDDISHPASGNTWSHYWHEPEGEDAPYPGAGGGGGAVVQELVEDVLTWVAKSGGAGGVGEIIIICPPPEIGGRCCCTPCPTREEAGLPETINVAFEILDSSADGMPSDEIVEECDGGDASFVFAYDDSIPALLSSMTFDFVELSGGHDGHVCCYLYEAQTDYTAECPGDAAPTKYLGPSPFISYAVGSSVSVTINVGGDSTVWSYSTSEDDPPATQCGVPIFDAHWLEWCCGSEAYWCDAPGGSVCITSSPELCNSTTYTFTGTEYNSTALHTGAELIICIEGDVVSIYLTIQIALECVASTGTGVRASGYRGRCSGIDGSGTCVENPSTLEFDGTEACAAVGTAMAFAVTLDLTEVAGATVWDRIQAAIWSAQSEFGLCNCGAPGCVGEYDEVTNTGSDIDPYSCICGGGTDSTEFSEEGHPVNVDCHYALVTMGLVFT